MRNIPFGALAVVATFTAILSAAAYAVSEDLDVQATNRTEPLPKRFSLLDSGQTISVLRAENSLAHNGSNEGIRVKSVYLHPYSHGTTSSTDITTAAASFALLSMSTQKQLASQQRTSGGPTVGFSTVGPAAKALATGHNGSKLFTDPGVTPYFASGTPSVLLEAVGSKTGTDASGLIAQFARKAAAPIQSSDGGALAATPKMAAVPLPAGALMLLLGLGLLRVIKRKTAVRL